MDDYVHSIGRESKLMGNVLETALYVEDAFGIVLNDDDISQQSLGSSRAILYTVMSKIECVESAE